MRTVIHSVQKFLKDEFTLVFALLAILALVLGSSGAR